MRHLRQLTRRSTFYERHEVVDPQGRVVNRQQRGEPHVHLNAMGRVPIDPQHPFLDDGSVVQITTSGYTDGAGRWHRVTRYHHLPGPDPSVLKPNREVLPTMDAPAQARTLARLLQDPQDPVPVVVQLRDRLPAQRPPPVAQTGLAFSEHHRLDTLSPRRQRLLAENDQRRRLEARPLCAWVRSVGGVVGEISTLYGSLLRVRVPRRHLPALLARPEVVRVEPRYSDPAPEGDVTDQYLCSNLPSRWIWGRDSDYESCEPTRAGNTIRQKVGYLDAVNAASGVLDYVDAGYTGRIGGGSANWGHPPHISHEAVPTLTYGIRDGQPLEANHPAFKWYGSSRFLYELVRPEDEIEVRVETDIAILSPVTDTPGDEKGHATRCAAIAIANAYLNGDAELTSNEDKGARSGVAREVTAMAAIDDVHLWEMIDQILLGLDTGEDDPPQGIDAISSSENEGHGEHVMAGGKSRRCVSDDDARGLDTGSLRIVYAHIDGGVIVTKAGGNDHHMLARCDTPFEISPPGASPAAIPSSALDTHGMTAAEMQTVESLRDDSNRAYTPDGRSYPLLAVLSQTCGVAETQATEDGDANSYGLHGQTSATAPRVAGAALIFKHWYLEQFGSHGNDAGRLMVNLLHFGDGHAWNTGGERVNPPYPGWGLGRFRMRLYTDMLNSNSSCWGTTSCAVWTDSFSVIDITNSSEPLPTGIRHLRITAWWLEVNTGEGEEKADIRMTLVYPDGAGEWSFDEAASGGEHVLRLQYDRDDTFFSCPPSGEVSLCLWAGSVPMERRSRFFSGGPTLRTRTVYVAWHWETGDDPTTITCSSSSSVPSTRCLGITRPPDRGHHLVASPGVAPADLAALRHTTELSIRDTLRVATGVAPSVGCGPVFEATG